MQNPERDGGEGSGEREMELESRTKWNTEQVEAARDQAKNPKTSESLGRGL